MSPPVFYHGVFSRINTILEVSQPAPEFSAVNQDEATITLKQYRGKKNVVLYFYPRDDTPGCTIDANEFTTLMNYYNWHRPHTANDGMAPAIAEEKHNLLSGIS